MFIVRDEKEYKIFRVQADDEIAFKKEYGKKVVAEGANLGEVVNKFQELDLPRMPINAEIETKKELPDDDIEAHHLKHRRRQQQ